MAFTHSSYLWALWGLLIPIAIHLWSKKEAKTVKIGSIQLLQVSDSKQSSRLHLNELLLLVLRMLIVAILVLLMAEPHVKQKVKSSSITYLVEPSLLQHKALKKYVDSIPEKVRLLQSGLPTYTANTDSSLNTPISYWALNREIAELPSDSIVIFTKAYLTHFKGKRPETYSHIHWIVLEDETPIHKNLMAIEGKTNLRLYNVSSSSKTTSINQEKLAKNDSSLDYALKDSVSVKKESMMHYPLKKEETIKVAIHYTDSLETEKTMIEAALLTIGNYLDKDIIITAEKSIQDSSYYNQHQLVVWLTKVALPDTKATTLRYQLDPYAASLISKTNQLNSYVLSSSLSAENSIREDLIYQLLQILPIDTVISKKVEEVDIRQMASNEIIAKNTVSPKKQQWSTVSLFNTLGLVLFILLLTERFLALYRKQ